MKNPSTRYAGFLPYLAKPRANALSLQVTYELASILVSSKRSDEQGLYRWKLCENREARTCGAASRSQDSTGT